MQLHHERVQDFLVMILLAVVHQSRCKKDMGLDLPREVFCKFQVRSYHIQSGDDGSEQFVALAGMGAFDAFTSRKVFEEAGTGLLA